MKYKAVPPETPGASFYYDAEGVRHWGVRLPLPTFDEWFKAREGVSFEEVYMGPYHHIDRAMKALTRALQDYTTEMVREVSDG